MTVRENQIVVYQPTDSVRLDVRLGNGTVKLKHRQMVQSVGGNVKIIGKHIASSCVDDLFDFDRVEM